jgi:hypothetical protein
LAGSQVAPAALTFYPVFSLSQNVCAFSKTKKAAALTFYPVFSLSQNVCAFSKTKKSCSLDFLSCFSHFLSQNFCAFSKTKNSSLAMPSNFPEFTTWKC